MSEADLSHYFRRQILFCHLSLYPPLLYLLAYSSLFQHERKNGQARHLSILPASIRYRLPEVPAKPFFVISARQGGVPDLQPCLLSQLIQYPIASLATASMRCTRYGRER